MANNIVYSNDGEYGSLREGQVGPLMQAQAGVVMLFTLRDLTNTAIDISGYTVTGKLKNRNTAVVGSITGATVVTGSAASGEFSWTTHANDVAEDGTYLLWFTLTKASSPTFVTLPLEMEIRDDEAVGGSFVSAGGVTVAMAEWLEAAEAVNATTNNFVSWNASDELADSGYSSASFQLADEELTALAGLTSAADRLPYFTGSGTAALTTLSSFIRTLLDDSSATAARTTLSAQAFDADLTAIAGLTSAADKLPYFTGPGTASLADFTAAARALLDDANAAAMLVTLGAVALAGGTMSGELNLADNLLTRPKLKDVGETINAIGSIGGGTQDIDLTLGNVVTGTVDTSATTFTFSNPSASGVACSFTLVLTNGGSQTVNWPAAVDWAGGIAPALTTAGIDILTFLTLDGGTIWYGFAAGIDMLSP